jgi:hypothetical protein
MPANHNPHPVRQNCRSEKCGRSVHSHFAHSHPDGFPVGVFSFIIKDCFTGGGSVIDGLESLYKQIADSMLNAIPEEWSSAMFEALFFQDSSTYEAEYTRKADGKQRGFQPSSGGSRAFRELRKKFKEAGKPVWGRACFQLNSNGTFNMKWGYDNCDENGDTLFSEEDELKRHEERRKRLTKE